MAVGVEQRRWPHTLPGFVIHISPIPLARSKSCQAHSWASRALPRLLRGRGSCRSSSGEPGSCAHTVALHGARRLADVVQPLLCNALPLC